MITKLENVHVFDGHHMTDRKEVYFNSDGVFTEPVKQADQIIDGQGKFLMPGLIDAHTHPISRKNADALLKNGVTTTCAISAPDELKNLPDSTRMFSTHSLATGSVTDGRSYVQREIQCGAEYIKIVVEDKPRMAKNTISQETMNEIADEAHKNNLLLATHAVSVATMQMAIKAGTDIYIHVPLEAEISEKMAQQIAQSGACCVPTLVMMKGFADSILYGYRKRDYEHAVNNVRKLHEAGVPILAGTDANNVFFLPTVKFGSYMHKEMELLAEAGLSSEEILQAATVNVASGYHMDKVGEISAGKYADFVLLNANPMVNVQNVEKIAQVWINGENVFTKK